MDGSLAGQVAADEPSTSGGIPPIVNGGNSMDLPSSVHLCSRFDDDPQRHFDGQLAYLGAHLPSSWRVSWLWNRASMSKSSNARWEGGRGRCGGKP